MNGYETDVDCGGYDCTPCGLNQTCQFNTDCSQKYCNNESKCDIPSCNDSINNGYETDVDCGGNCTQCQNGMKCNENSDCLSNYCDFGVCDIEGQQPPEQQYQTKSNKPIILLVFSLLLIFGGAGYLVYKKYFMKKPPQQTKIQPQTPQNKPALPPLMKTRNNLSQMRARRLMSTSKLKKILEEKQNKRDELFSKFAGGKSEDEHVEKNKIEGLFPLPEKPIKKTKIERKEELQKNIKRKGYIDLSELKTKLLGKQKPDEFKKLEEITRNLKKKGITKNIITPKDDEELFKKLDEISKGQKNKTNKNGNKKQK